MLPPETLPPGDPSGGVVYLLITTEWLIKRFILGTKSYMLRHQGAILIGFIKRKDCNSNTYVVLIAPTFVRFR